MKTSEAETKFALEQLLKHPRVHELTRVVQVDGDGSDQIEPLLWFEQINRWLQLPIHWNSRAQRL